MNRCLCLTSSGKQCSRDAKPGSEYCWQHQSCKKYVSSQPKKQSPKPQKQSPKSQKQSPKPQKQSPKSQKQSPKPQKQSPKSQKQSPLFKYEPKKQPVEIFRNISGAGLLICGGIDDYVDQIQTLGGHYYSPKDCYVIGKEKQKEILDLFGMNESMIQPKFTGKYVPKKQPVEIFRNVSGAGLLICGGIDDYVDQIQTLGGHYYPPKDCYVIGKEKQKEILNLFGMNESMIQPKFTGKYLPKK